MKRTLLIGLVSAALLAPLSDANAGDRKRWKCDGDRYYTRTVRVYRECEPEYYYRPRIVRYYRPAYYYDDCAPRYYYDRDHPRYYRAYPRRSVSFSFGFCR